MTQPAGLLTRAVNRAVPVYLWLIHGLEALTPLFDLSVRLYLANIFWKGGMVKLSSWMSTVMLFTMVYDVPVLPPEIAAYLSTAVELGGSFLLAIGLAGRCLLYTSDAADERSSVDLGGRRIITKKTTSVNQGALID